MGTRKKYHRRSIREFYVSYLALPVLNYMAEVHFHYDAAKQRRHSVARMLFMYYSTLRWGSMKSQLAAVEYVYFILWIFRAATTISFCYCIFYRAVQYVLGSIERTRDPRHPFQNKLEITNCLATSSELTEEQPDFIYSL